MSQEKNLKLSKQTLPELQELLERQDALLRNKKLLEHLKDKGEHIKQLRERIQQEIQCRRDTDKIQASLSTLTIGSNQNSSDILNEKHVEYVCSKEMPIEDTRYRPHRTLVHKAEKTSPQKSPKKFVEVTAAFEPYLIHEPTKCIPLAESLVIQTDQARKVMEEQVKRSLRILNFNVEQENSSSESDEEQALEEELSVDAVK